MLQSRSCGRKCPCASRSSAGDRSGGFNHQLPVKYPIVFRGRTLRRLASSSSDLSPVHTADSGPWTHSPSIASYPPRCFVGPSVLGFAPRHRGAAEPAGCAEDALPDSNRLRLRPSLEWFVRHHRPPRNPRRLLLLTRHRVHIPGGPSTPRAACPPLARRRRPAPTERRASRRSTSAPASAGASPSPPRPLPSSRKSPRAPPSRTPPPTLRRWTRRASRGSSRGGRRPRPADGGVGGHHLREFLLEALAQAAPRLGVEDQTRFVGGGGRGGG